ncbi:MAG: RNA polymerase sigma factor [Gammaproteobacteria bacterium]
MAEEPTNGPSGDLSSRFDTTEWTMVLTAADLESPQVGRALEVLCRAYWYPLYAHVRRRGHDVHAAQDLTQEFFARLLEKQWLKSVGPERGRFRTFLLVAMDRFLAKEYRAEHALKRGGGVALLSLEDTRLGEERYERELAAPADGRAFDRDWANAVIERAYRQLEKDYTSRGRAIEFENWKPFLEQEATTSDCEKLGARLEMKPGAVAVAIHRFRERYAGLLRHEVARTVSDRAELEEELRHLFELLDQ